MPYENDHTDAELARRDHAAEMGGSSPMEELWLRWAHAAGTLLVGLGASTVQVGLDGSEDEDGYSLDGGYAAFLSGVTVPEYFERVAEKRRKMGLPFLTRMRIPTPEEQAILDRRAADGDNHQNRVNFFSQCFKEHCDSVAPNNDHLEHLNLAIVDVINAAYEKDQ